MARRQSEKAIQGFLYGLSKNNNVNYIYRTNEIVKFDSIITYRWGKKPIERIINSFCQIYTGPGGGYGDIIIEEIGDFQAEDFHTGFSPAFQSYRYIKSNLSIVIDGNSDKMHGSYRVHITPNI